MIRVLRLIEYTYVNIETAEDDRAHWKLPAIGTYKPNGNKTIRSTILTDLNYAGEIRFELEDDN